MEVMKDGMVQLEIRKSLFLLFLLSLLYLFFFKIFFFVSDQKKKKRKEIRKSKGWACEMLMGKEGRREVFDHILA